MTETQRYLKQKIDDEILLYYKDPSQYPQEKYEKVLERWSDDSIFNEKHRFDLLNLFVPDLQNKKILDMAAGCGSFVLQGLRNGYTTLGVEPEKWKQDVIDLKFTENDYPAEWREHIKQGTGEDLPFEDESFDVFDSWQTIEHVDDEKSCILELYRVLKPGGCGILRGPDYLSFFEGHYGMLWFPHMKNGPLARLYLKLRNRPEGGLDTFHNVNSYRIRKYARQAGFRITDIKRYQIYAAIERRIPITRYKIFKAFKWGVYLMWDMYRGIRYFGKREATISFFLEKP